jgi:C1A family cysteine protease
VGGHAVIIVGHSDEKQAFKVRNSWSKYWGINGDFWMPYIIMESQFVDDLWKITFIEK